MQATASSPHSSVSPSFEEALKELEIIVQKFENNVWTLEQAVEAYKRGLELKDMCSQKLEAAKLVLETVSKGAGAGEAQGFSEAS